jgi:glycosyltransferase involved in cell wall biosynthesis
MRLGKNPAKTGLPAYTPKPLGIALIVYIPYTEGYFKQSLEILQYQIASIRATTVDYDLMIFDNGSCAEAVETMKSFYEQKWLDWLVLSQHNVGKAGAWNWIFAALPNPLICYADSDVLFRPGWADASIEILESFPQAGMVAAQPNFFDVMEGSGQAHHKLQNDSRFDFIDYWPEKRITDEYCTGIAASEQLAERFYNNPLPAIKQKDNGTRAVIGASHMQFLIRQEVARQVVPLPATKGLLRKETMSLDFIVDELGYMHLSTLEPYVYHMGNAITDDLREEVQSISGGANTTGALPASKDAARPASKKRQWLAKMAKRPQINRWLQRLYNALFQILHSTDLDA